MSRNINMHPRNIYKIPPDYTELAIKFPNFRKVCKLELDGKVSINLKNEHVLKELSKTLLLNDFDLKIEIPEYSLVPTIPLRLNYVLWIEDILKEFNIFNAEGIDIGCGAVAIYCILLAKKFKWKMIGFESDLENMKFANLNIQNNNLQNEIKLFHQKDTNVIFKSFFELQENQNSNFTFCMCNPPFYKDQSELPSFKYKNRKLPRNKSTGKNPELICEGGEITFVNKIITESTHLKEKILFYTTMLGHKSSISVILKILHKNNIFNITQTEFCQGHTTRWGIAWSFSNDLNLKNMSQNL